MQDTLIKKYLLLDRDPRLVWGYLTEPKHLQMWLADRVEVAPRLEGNFELGGKGAIYGHIPGRITEWARFEQLTLVWEVGGTTTRVHFSLEAHLDMTRLLVAHVAPNRDELKFTTFQNHQGVRGKKKLCLEDYWWGTWGRLKYYAATGREPFKPDYAKTGGDVMEFHLPVKADARAAFKALSREEGINAWFGKDAKIDLRTGGRFDIGWSGNGPQQITELKPGSKIAYSWRYGNEPETRVAWQVLGKGSEAEIVLVHSGFGRMPEAFDDYNLGWSSYLVYLALYLEAGIREDGSFYGNG